jgi:hypothetical protein
MDARLMPSVFISYGHADDATFVAFRADTAFSPGWDATRQPGLTGPSEYAQEVDAALGATLAPLRIEPARRGLRFMTTEGSVETHRGDQPSADMP